MFDLMQGGMMGAMGNDSSVPADSFQGGLEDLQSALMEQNATELDELTTRKHEQQMQGQDQENQMLMAIMQMMGGG